MIGPEPIPAGGIFAARPAIKRAGKMHTFCGTSFREASGMGWNPANRFLLFDGESLWKDSQSVGGLRQGLQVAAAAQGQILLANRGELEESLHAVWCLDDEPGCRPFSG